MIEENIAQLIEKVKEEGDSPGIAQRAMEHISYCKGFELAQNYGMWEFAQKYLKIFKEYECPVNLNIKVLDGAGDAARLGLAKFTEKEMKDSLGTMLAYLSRSPKI